MYLSELANVKIERIKLMNIGCWVAADCYNKISIPFWLAKIFAILSFIFLIINTAKLW